MSMKEGFQKLKDGNCTTAEIILTGICLFLLGVVIGMKIAPSRFSTFGSFNGNQGSVGTPEEIMKGIKK
ncbi:MAG: hypothetical protein K6F53_09585 [Lachnospiraceae bacterium]|nr:hypothetical protein [Lachnospiraceae bacterium]